MLLHPLFSLKYNFDPSLPKIMKVFLLLFRFVLAMTGCFYFLYNEENADELYYDYYDYDPWQFWAVIIKSSYIAAAFSIIFLPIHGFMLCCCRSKFKLIHVKNDMEDDISTLELDEKKEYQEYEEKIKKDNYYIDPTLPIKLLFIITQESDFKLV